MHPPSSEPSKPGLIAANLRARALIAHLRSFSAVACPSSRKRKVSPRSVTHSDAERAILFLKAASHLYAGDREEVCNYS